MGGLKATEKKPQSASQCSAPVWGLYWLHRWQLFLSQQFCLIPVEIPATKRTHNPQRAGDAPTSLLQHHGDTVPQFPQKTALTKPFFNTFWGQRPQKHVAFLKEVPLASTLPTSHLKNALESRQIFEMRWGAWGGEPLRV